jgi:hypothetical protein
MLKELLLSATLNAISPAGQYQQATSKAEEAAMVQTKVSSYADATESVVSGRVHREAERAGVERGLAAVAYAYGVAKTRQVSLPTHRALSATWALTVGQEGSKLSLIWSF